MLPQGSMPQDPLQTHFLFSHKCLLLMCDRFGMSILTTSWHGCQLLPRCSIQSWMPNSTGSSGSLIRLSGSIRHGWTNTTRNLTHSVNCLKTSKRKFPFSEKTELTVAGWVVIRQATLLPQSGHSRRRSGARRTCSCAVSAPIGSRPSQKIDRLEYKRLSDELLSMLPTCLRNDVVVRAPFAANYQVSLGIKGGGGWDSCREARDALFAGIEARMLEVRGETLFVAILFSPRRKVTLSNMFKGEVLMKERGVNPEAHMLCPGSSNILNTATNEDLDKTPTGSNTWIWHREKNVHPVACRCQGGKSLPLSS